MTDTAALTHQQVTIVFDSHRPLSTPFWGEGQAGASQVSGVQAIFSGRTRSADHVIERPIVQAGSELSRRPEDRLHPPTRERLDRIRRGEDPTTSA